MADLLISEFYNRILRCLLIIDFCCVLGFELISQPNIKLISMAYFKARIGFLVQKHQIHTTCKNRIIRPLSLILRGLLPIY